MLDNAV